MNKVMQTRQHYDMANWSQKRDACGLVFQVAAWGCNGSLAELWCNAERPHNWIPEHDGRTKEGKALAAADKALFAALNQYDNARRALIAAKLSDKR